jgi:tripartite-type tricarboxylate transporter receptor subunit TctC
VKAGRLRPVITGGSRRSAHMPDVPTGVEAGFPYFQSTAWHAVVVPAGTPRAAISQLHRTLVAALATPELRAKLAVLDVEPIGSTPGRARPLSTRRIREVEQGDQERGNRTRVIPRRSDRGNIQ